MPTPIDKAKLYAINYDLDFRQEYTALIFTNGTTLYAEIDFKPAGASVVLEDIGTQDRETFEIDHTDQEIKAAVHRIREHFGHTEKPKGPQMSPPIIESLPPIVRKNPVPVLGGSAAGIIGVIVLYLINPLAEDQNATDRKVTEVATEIRLVKKDIDSVTETANKNKTDVSAINLTLVEVNTNLKNLNTNVDKFDKKLDDLIKEQNQRDRSRSRRSRGDDQ